MSSKYPKLTASMFHWPSSLVIFSSLELHYKTNDALENNFCISRFWNPLLFPFQTTTTLQKCPPRGIPSPLSSVDNNPFILQWLFFLRFYQQFFFPLFLHFFWDKIFYISSLEITAFLTNSMTTYTFPHLCFSIRPHFTNPFKSLI